MLYKADDVRNGMAGRAMVPLLQRRTAFRLPQAPTERNSDEYIVVARISVVGTSATTLAADALLIGYTLLRCTIL